MKVLFVTNLYPPHHLGGYEILCQQVVDAMRERGHEVSVLTSTFRMAGVTDGAEPFVRRELLLSHPFDEPEPPLLRLHRLRASRANVGVTARHISELAPDVVFLWSQLRLSMGPARAAQAFGRTVAWSLNDENILGYTPSAWGIHPRDLARALVERTAMQEGTLRGLGFRNVTCISRRLKANLLERGLPVQRARVIYQGVPLEHFPLKDEVGAAHDPLRILFVGQLQWYKGAHTFVRAAHWLERLGLRVEATLVGDGFGPYGEALRREAAEGPASIRFLGRVPHEAIARVYHEHDVFVFPSIWEEPFGLTPLEAMACGLPVVSTVDGGHAELIVDGVNALVFQKEDEQDLARQISRLAHSRALRTRLALAGREAVERGFGFQRYLDDIEGFLHAVVARRDQPVLAAPEGALR